MSIVRYPRKISPSSFIPAIEDARLTWQARGIFVYLWQRPADQRTTVNDLVQQGNLGRDGVYAALKNLRVHGYLDRWLQRDAQGRIIDSDWLLYETPEDNPDYRPAAGTARKGEGRP